MSEIKLLPCPFCGHSPIMAPNKGVVHIYCLNCGCTVNPFVIEDSEGEAAAAWNTRTKPIKRTRSRTSEKENRADS